MIKKTIKLVALVLAYSYMGIQLHAYQDGSALKDAVKAATAVRTSEAPAIDGLLDDQCWKKASFTSNFYDFKTRGSAKQKTEFAFCFDADTVYLAIRCQCGDQYTPKSSENFWDGDLLELFFDPGSSGCDYFHIAVTPDGMVFKERGYGRSDSLWAPHVRAAGHVKKGEWTLEMALPLAEFQFREPIGSVWLINIVRLDHENNGSYYTWAPTFGDLHQIVFFQPLKGVDVDMSRFLWETEIKENSISSGKSSSVKLGVHNFSGKRQLVQLTMKTQQIGKLYPITSSLGTFSVDGDSSITVVSPALFNEKGRYLISLEIRDPLNSLLFRSGVYELEKPLEPMRISCIQKVYYRNEKNCKIETQLLGPSPKESQIQFVLKSLKDSNKVIRKDIAIDNAGKATVEFELQGLQPGDYEVTATLQGYSVAKKQFSILSRNLEFSTVSINGNGTLLIAGKFFFPRGLFMPGPWWEKSSKCPTDESDWNDIKSKGFNVINYSPFWMKTFMSPATDGSRMSFEDKQNTWSTLDQIHKTGLKASMVVNRFLAFPEPDLNGLRDYVSEFRGHPAVLCWYLADEPDGSGIPPETVRKAYQIIKEVDPNHPVCVLVMGAFISYRSTADVIMADKYPILDADSRPGNTVYSISKAGVNSLKTGQAFWMVPQFFCNYPQEPWKRCPTPAEATLMSFQAICGGARGLFYFSYARADKRSPEGIPSPYPLVRKRLSWELWEGSKRMNELLTAAEPFILEGKCNSEIITVQTSNNTKSIQNSTFLLDKTALIILCNSEPASSVIQINGLSKWQDVVCMDVSGEQNLKIKNGSVIVEMKPYTAKLLFCH
ncbi:MAG: sugar-binding protein [Victivallaceae bacterium]|jgi:hypothetical protein